MNCLPNAMEKLLFSFLLLPIACSVREQKLGGAYEVVSESTDSSTLDKDRVYTVALFKNGCWITTSFTQTSIIKCSGGYYNIRNKYCVQTVNFNSIDTFTIGKEYRHDYNSDEKYLIANFAGISANKVQNEKDLFKKVSTSDPLENASLEGAWMMKSGQGGYNTNNDDVIRIFSYPYFVRTIYSLKEKRFNNVYGGTYQFDGKVLIEKVEYSNYQIPPGSTIEWIVKKLNGKEMQLFDIDSFNDEEIFEQISNQ